MINFMKLFLLFFMMTMGFFLVYSLIWTAFDLPLTGNTITILLALAGLSEFGYYLWIR